jgi:plastocyanin
MTTRTAFRNALMALGAVAALGIAFVPAVGATPAPAAVKHKSPIRTVQVRDDYFTPTKLTVKRGTTIKWVWSMHNYDTHNVTLTSGPKGVKKSRFRSIDGTSGIVFTRTLTVLGTYHFICTMHPTEMKMTIVVKR